MSMTSEEFWMGEARKFESWFYQANYARAQQEAENAKLRELVRDMWQEHECCHLTWPATIADRMRELGVDDG